MENLDSENLANQSELHLLDNSNCRNFNAGFKILFSNPLLRYKCEVSNWVAFPGQIYNESVVTQKYSIKYEVKTILKHISELSHNQGFDGLINILDFSLLLCYKTMTFPMKTSLKTNKPGWRRKEILRFQWINLNYIFWIFRDVETSVQGSKKLISHSKCTLQLWSFQINFFFGKNHYSNSSYGEQPVWLSS